MLKIAVFVSGGGTDLQSVIDAVKNNSINGEIAIVISNRKNAYGLERARQAGIETAVVRKDDELIVKMLKERNVGLVVLAGYLAILTDVLIDAYPNKIINIHPALLPKFGGKGMYGDRVHEAVVMAGESESGITIHYIDEHYDEGSIIFQAKCSVLPGDTPAEVAKKVHALEYEWFPRIIEQTVNTFL